MLKKKDLLLITIVIITALAFFAAKGLSQRGQGETLRIMIDGKLQGEYPLLEDRTIIVDGASGYNKIVIENGAAYMGEADCPDKYCMDYKPISRGNETIICLPHKLVVEITGVSEKGQPDIIAQ